MTLTADELWEAIVGSNGGEDAEVAQSWAIELIHDECPPRIFSLDEVLERWPEWDRLNADRCERCRAAWLKRDPRGYAAEFRNEEVDLSGVPSIVTTEQNGGNDLSSFEGVVRDRLGGGAD